jgi:hypothetical protein
MELHSKYKTAVDAATSWEPEKVAWMLVPGDNTTEQAVQQMTEICKNLPSMMKWVDKCIPIMQFSGHCTSEELDSAKAVMIDAQRKYEPELIDLVRINVGCIMLAGFPGDAFSISTPVFFRDWDPFNQLWIEVSFNLPFGFLKMVGCEAKNTIAHVLRFCKH